MLGDLLSADLDVQRTQCKNRSISSLAQLSLADLRVVSVSYFYVLLAKATIEPQVALLNDTIIYLKSATLEILEKVATEDLASFVSTISELAMAHQAHKQCVLAMYYACILFPNQITPFHPEMLKHALKAHVFLVVSPIIDQHIALLDTKTMHITIEQVLLYFYYAGRIYLGLQNFQRANDCFKMCLACPAAVASSIQLEAYKRAILTDLVLVSKSAPLDLFIAPNVSNALRDNVQPYAEFAKAFETGPAERVHDRLQALKQTFVSDQTFGLAAHCMVVWFSRKIQRLTETYISISMHDLSDLLGPLAAATIGDLECHMMAMVKKGDIHILISQGSNGRMVSFHGDVLQAFDDKATGLALHTAQGVADKIYAELEVLHRDAALKQETARRSIAGTAMALGEEEDFPTPI